MSATVETLDISPVGRVEGDLDVRGRYRKWRCHKRMDASRNVPWL